MMQKTVIIAMLSLLCLSISAQTDQHDVTVIELIQTEGQFEINQLNLVAGKYQFRVVNQGVKKDLGFVIQKESDKDQDVMKTAVENSFTSTYVKNSKAEYTGVEMLKKGTYVYSCPLNPTPHYRIVVK